jgi:MFS family permease
MDAEVSASTPVRGEFARGWRIVLAATVGVALGLSPIPFYEIGVFAPELAREFHWSVASIMGGVFFMMCGSMAGSPAVGFLADRFGTRRVALASVACFGGSLALFPLQTGSLPLYYATWFVMALSGAGTLPITWTRAINQAFDTRKGLALGIALAGGGLSGFLLKPATAAIVAAYGWRAGFLFLALLPLLISLPVAAIFLRAAPGQSAAPGPAAESHAVTGYTFGEAVRDRRFWIIGLGILPVAFAVAGAIANLDSILRGSGLSREAILGVVPFLGLAVIAGRLGGGWLVDRFWAPGVAMALFVVSALGSWLLANGGAAPGVAAFGVIGVGLAAGLEFDLMAFLTARYFGRRHYGSIYGTLYGFFALGSGVAPAVYGRAFDASGSFTRAVSLGAAAMLCGGLLLLLLGPYRFRAPHAASGA